MRRAYLKRLREHRRRQIPPFTETTRYAIPGTTSSLNLLTTSNIPPSSTWNPNPTAYPLSNTAGQLDTTLLFVSSSSNCTNFKASSPSTSRNTSSSSRMEVVNPGKQTTRVCERNENAGTWDAMTRFVIVVWVEATQILREPRAGDSRESPIGQTGVRGVSCWYVRIIAEIYIN